MNTTASGEDTTRRCLNCGEPLLGEHCYSCGQPTKGLVRQFSTFIGDFLDSVFEFDSRTVQTIGPLLLKPGHLSLEYFAGRRVRYVSPVRLFVFMSLFAFFAAQLSFDLEAGDGPAVQFGNDEGSKTVQIQDAKTVEEVELALDEIVARLEQGRQGAANVPGVGAALDVAEEKVRAEAAARIEQLRQAEAPKASPADAPAAEGAADGEAAGAAAVPDPGADAPVPPAPAVDAVADAEGKPSIQVNGEPWDPVTNPVKIDALPQAMNDRLNAWVGRAQDNIARIQKDPNLLKDAFLSTVPSTLFLLLPVFALLLKIAYLFKRRLYMEHLVVALHSHSFLCFALLLVLVLDAVAGWTAGWPWLSRPLGWLEVALLAWMPVYLLVMQKRVYKQGWIMTLLKFGVLGMLYAMLLVFGAIFSLMASLVSM